MMVLNFKNWLLWLWGDFKRNKISLQGKSEFDDLALSVWLDRMKLKTIPTWLLVIVFSELLASFLMTILALFTLYEVPSVPVTLMLGLFSLLQFLGVILWAIWPSYKKWMASIA